MQYSAKLLATAIAAKKQETPNNSKQNAAESLFWTGGSKRSSKRTQFDRAKEDNLA
jgi:hypothetical protein